MVDVLARTVTVTKHRGIEISYDMGGPVSIGPYVIGHPLFEGETYQLIQHAREAIDAAYVRVARLYQSCKGGAFSCLKL